MSTGTLFVSFWHICLENLPEGVFTRRRITPDDARLLIEDSQRRTRLRCVSEKDLIAPYNEHERSNHDALRGALAKHYGIKFAFRDFTGSHEAEGECSYSVVPLNCVQVKGNDRLLVITCCYTLGKKTKANPLQFDIAPDTIEFHLFA